MTRHARLLVVLAVLGLVATPSGARAETFLSPFVGGIFGNNSGDGQVAVGLNGGWLGGGVLGFEFDLGYVPDFFGDSGNFGANSVLDVMGNVIVKIPAGGTTGRGFHPYLSVGAGLLRTKLDGLASNNGNSVSSNDLGLNAGVGATGYLADHFGIRGDVRYFRNLDDTSRFEDASVGIGGFHFWRASIGVVWRP